MPAKTEEKAGSAVGPYSGPTCYACDVTPASPTQPDPAPPARAGRSRARWGRRALIAVTLLGALAGGAYTARAPFLRWLVTREARAYGVVLTPGEVDLGDGSVRLRDSWLSLDRVEGLRAHLDDTRITLDGRAPRRVDAAGATIAIEGSPTTRLREIAAWSRAHPEVYAIPTSVTGARLTWSEQGAAKPWLTLGGGELVTSDAGMTIRVAQLMLNDRFLGGLIASTPKDASVITVDASRGGAPGRPEDADLHVVYKPGAKGARSAVDVKLRTFTLDELAPLLVVPGVSRRATVDAGLAVTLDEREAIEGSTSVTIKGWIPPHPRQADGILYGDRTAVSTGFRVTEDHRRATLHDTRVTVGALELKGGGSADIGPDFAIVRVELNGAVPCTQAARSAAVSDWGDEIGNLLGNVARKTLEGAIAVKIFVEADTRNPRAARITQDIGVGCGLKIPKLF